MTLWPRIKKMRRSIASTGRIDCLDSVFMPLMYTIEAAEKFQLRGQSSSRVLDSSLVRGENGVSSNITGFSDRIQFLILALCPLSRLRPGLAQLRQGVDGLPGFVGIDVRRAFLRRRGSLRVDGLEYDHFLELS